jgi:hypothetical protein
VVLAVVQVVDAVVHLVLLVKEILVAMVEMGQLVLLRLGQVVVVVEQVLLVLMD